MLNLKSSSQHKKMKLYEKYTKLNIRGLPKDLIRRKMIYDGFKTYQIEDYFDFMANNLMETSLVDKNSMSKLAIPKSGYSLYCTEAEVDSEHTDREFPSIEPDEAIENSLDSASDITHHSTSAEHAQRNAEFIKRLQEASGHSSPLTNFSMTYGIVYLTHLLPHYVMYIASTDYRYGPGRRGGGTAGPKGRRRKKNTFL